MSIFSRIFGLQSKSDESAKSSSPEIIRIEEFEKELRELLDRDAYLARSDYKPLCAEYKDLLEERRLFYVALTRTKNRVYIVTPKEHPSEFVVELLNDYHDIKVNGDLVLEDATENVIVNRCPICGYPLQLRYKKAYGLKLWICSNEPEMCDFMSNNLKGGILPIMKCDKCRDGYMIVKEGKGLPFLGCTNYRSDRTGCNNMLSKENYINLYGKKD